MPSNCNCNWTVHHMSCFPALLLALLMMEQPRPSLPGMTKAELHDAEAGVPTGRKAQRSVLQFKGVPEKPPVQAEAAHINIPGSARHWEIPATVLCVSSWRTSATSLESRVSPSQALPHHGWRSYSATLGAIWKEGESEKAEIKTANSVTDPSNQTAEQQWALGVSAGFSSSFQNFKSRSSFWLK